MAFQSEAGTIRWRMHFNSSPAKVYNALNTDSGRAGYWAESAPEHKDRITFHILNYEPFTGRILEREAHRSFILEYFATVVKFKLEDDGHGGTDLSLLVTEVDESIRMEMTAGWISVLMSMKAAVDHGVDLRNHDSTRSWQQGFVDN